MEYTSMWWRKTWKNIATCKAVALGNTGILTGHTQKAPNEWYKRARGAIAVSDHSRLSVIDHHFLWSLLASRLTTFESTWEDLLCILIQTCLYNCRTFNSTPKHNKLFKFDILELQLAIAGHVSARCLQLQDCITRRNPVLSFHIWLP